MIIINSTGSVQTGAQNISDFVKPKNQILLKEILSSNGLCVEEFRGLENSCLIVSDQEEIVPGIVKDVAGLRLSVLTSPKTSYSGFTDTVWRQLELAGSLLGADMVQLLVPREEKSKVKSVRSVCLENFVFAKPTGAQEASSETNVDEIDFTTQEVATFLAELEFLSRLQFPSSSYRPKDRILDIVDEYKTFPLISDICGLCIDGDLHKGFVIWWKNALKKSAIVIHLWVPANSRGQSLGVDLLNAMASSLWSEGIESMDYFVSASNLGAIKTLNKASFNLKYLVLNRMITKGKAWS